MRTDSQGEVLASVETPPRDETFWPSVRYWAGHGSATIFDQGFVSGSNFLLGVLLARFLGPEKYGIYVLVFSTFLFAAQMHQALILDPTAALQPAFYPTQPRGYVATVLRLHMGLSLALLPIVVIGIYFTSLHNPQLSAALWGLLPAIPLILLFWTQRTGMYLRPAPIQAAAGSVIYSAAMLIGAAGCIALGILSPFAGFCVMSAASFVAWTYLWRSPAAAERLPRPRTRKVWRLHWDFGKWLIGVQAIGWVQSTCLLFMTGSILGTKQVGVLTSMVAMALPLQHILIAGTRLLMPKLSGTLATQGLKAFQRLISRVAIISTSCGILYLLLIVVIHQPLVRLVYGAQYVEYAHLVPWYMISIALSAATFPYDVGTKVMRVTRLQLYVNCVTAVFTLIVGALAILRWGLEGVIVTNVSKDILVLSLTNYAYRWAGRKMSQELPRDQEPELEV